MKGTKKIETPIWHVDYSEKKLINNFIPEGTPLRIFSTSSGVDRSTVKEKLNNIYHDFYKVYLNDRRKYKPRSPEDRKHTNTKMTQVSQELHSVLCSSGRAVFYYDKRLRKYAIEFSKCGNIKYATLEQLVREIAKHYRVVTVFDIRLGSSDKKLKELMLGDLNGLQMITD